MLFFPYRPRLRMDLLLQNMCQGLNKKDISKDPLDGYSAIYKTGMGEGRRAKISGDGMADCGPYGDPDG